MKISKALKKQITKSIHDAVIQFLLDKLAGTNTGSSEPQDFVWEKVVSEPWYRGLYDEDVLLSDVGEIINDQLFKAIDAQSALLKSFLK